MSYPVVWRNQTYTLGDITIGVKKAFVKWCKVFLTNEGIDNLGHRPDLLQSYLANLYAELWWSDAGQSPPVAKALRTPEGGLYINRLLFGDSVRVLSDADLTALINEKESEQEKADAKAEEAGVKPPYPPVNDYMVAMQSIRDAADPKALASGEGRTGGTSSTACT